MWVTPEFMEDISHISKDMFRQDEQGFILSHAKGENDIKQISKGEDIGEDACHVSNVEMKANMQTISAPDIHNDAKTAVHATEALKMVDVPEDQFVIESPLMTHAFMDYEALLLGDDYDRVKDALRMLFLIKNNLLAEVNDLEKKKSSLLEASLRDRQEWLSYKQSLGQICKMIGAFTSPGGETQSNALKKIPKKGDAPK